MLKQTVFFAVVIGIAVCNVRHMNRPPMPEKFKGAEGCYYEPIDDYCDVGNVINYGDPCVQVLCFEDHMEEYTCPEVKESKFVKREPGDSSSSYPQCCDTAMPIM